jgi:hypothetical protein
VLQACPDLHTGWSLGEIELRHEAVRHVFEQDLETAYQGYLKEQRTAGRFRTDKPLLRVVNNPDVFSDRPHLVLRLQENLYSEVQFFRNNISVLAAARHRYIEQADKGVITFPNSLCLQLAVATADGWLLVTERSHKVDAFRGLWSCSIEEQLDLQDVARDPTYAAEEWCRRALREELGISRDHYASSNVRIFGVFLECDALNINLGGLALLNVERAELDAIIDKHPRTDYEFSRWDFISWSSLADELLAPSRAYHPSSGLRMFFAGVFRFGAVEFGRQLYEAKRHKS